MWRSRAIRESDRVTSRADVGAFVLGAAGLVVLGLASFGSFASWLPIIVLIPAFALFIKTDRTVVSLLVLTVAIAVAQVLHAYPVAASQIAWSTVAMAVPCSIAVGVGLQSLAGWRGLPIFTRGVTTVGICVFLMLGAGLWAPQQWHDYLANPRLDLPGTRLLRLESNQAGTLQSLTSYLKQNCDTFYSLSPSDSLYFYTGIPSPSGQTVDNFGILTTPQQQEIVAALDAAVKKGERVCVVHNGDTYAGWAASSTGKGPLGRFVTQFNNEVSTIGLYSVWTMPPPTPGAN